MTDSTPDRGGAVAPPVGEPVLPPLVPRLHLEELLPETPGRAPDAVPTRDRLHGLLEAVLAIGSKLELPVVLRRIVEAGIALADARYGALGVIGPDQRLAEFIQVGVDSATIEAIGSPPEGHGILGLLIADPRPLRLADLGAHPASYGFPPNHPSMRTFLGVPIRVRDKVFGNLYLTEKRGGGEFTAEDEGIVLALAAAAGVAIENARLYQTTRRREQWLEASSEITTALLSGAEPSSVLSLVARRARELSNGDLALIALPTADGVALILEVAEGLHADRLRGAVLPVTDSLAGQVYSTAEPVIVDDVAADRRVRGPLGEPADFGPAMFVPLGSSDRAVGTLTVVNRLGSLPFAAEDLRLVATFSGQAALALELAEATRDHERLAVYEDRDRIARDLHDLVIQRLFATGMLLEGASRLVTHPDAQNRVKRAVDDLDETIREIRSTIFALQSPQDEEVVGVRARILAIADQAAQSLGFAPSIRLNGPIDTLVPESVAEHLLAALREALSNATRHAHASAVEIIVDAGKELVLEVRDDGQGMTEGGRRSGLRNLRERAIELGGTCYVESAPGQGTVLIWRVPLK